MNLDIREFPKLKADNLRDAKLLRVSLRDQDVEKAKLILTSLFNHLKRDLDKKIDVEIKGIDTQISTSENEIKKKNIDIQSKEIEKTMIKQGILSAQNKLKISEERFKNIMDEMKAVKQRIDEIEKLNNEIENIKNQIDLLNKRKGRIDYAQLIKEPTSSLYPVSPRKKLNVLIAGILSLMIFTILAFFLEYVGKYKATT